MFMARMVLVAILVVVILGVIQPVFEPVLEQIIQLLQSVFGPHSFFPQSELFIIEEARVEGFPEALLPPGPHLLPYEDNLLATISPFALKITSDCLPDLWVLRPLILGDLTAPAIATGNSQHDTSL
jgi:hypothetical protein